jgi:hypothetical protein
MPDFLIVQYISSRKRGKGYRCFWILTILTPQRPASVEKDKTPVG